MRTHMSRRGERGFSLAEVLTATAIFALIFVAALMVYDRSNRVYKLGVEASDMQQNTRVAFDRLVADLRMAGFDFDRDGNPLASLAYPWQPNKSYSIGNLVQPDPPNGHTYLCVSAGTTGSTPPAWKTTRGERFTDGDVEWEEIADVVYQQPDEQIEFAGRSAVVIRANFNYDWALGECKDATTPCENGREPFLQSPVFPVVTTDNDEIVAYALKPTRPPATTDTLTFYADLTRPRSVHPGTQKAEQKISIPGVDLCKTGCNNPPYTLYRFHWDNDGKLVSTPVADNIRELEFGYFRDAGGEQPIADIRVAEFATYPEGEGAYNGEKPHEIPEQRDLRADIRAIRIMLKGMNPQMDGAYTDVADSIAPRYRKYALETLIVPRNIGRHGMREFASTAPGDPILRTVCAGSCNAAYLVWTPPQTGGDVETYNMIYDTGPCSSQPFSYSEDAGRNVDGYAYQWLSAPGQQWRFAVQAVNKYGVGVSNCIDLYVENTTKPTAPTSLTATGVSPAAEENQITLTWPDLILNQPGETSQIVCKANTGGVSLRGTPEMPWAESKYFRIHRGTATNFTPSATNKVLDEYSLQQPAQIDDVRSWTDRRAANCKPYFYRIQTADFCARNPAFNKGGDASLGVSTAFYPPIGQPAIRGEAMRLSGRPAAPEGLIVDETGTVCSGVLCDVKLRWGAVIADEGAGPEAAPIFIDQYVITQERFSGTSWVSSGPDIVVTDGKLETTITGLPDPDIATPYRFRVRAKDCVEGADSAPVRFRCNFGPNATVAVAAPVSYGGDGTSAGSAWIVDRPATLTVSATAPITRLVASFFQNSEPVGSFTHQPGSPFTSVSVPIAPAAADDVPIEVVFALTDAFECTASARRWVIDMPAPGCALLDKLLLPAPSPAVERFCGDRNPPAGCAGLDDRHVIYTLHNDTADPLTVRKIVVTWTPGERHGAVALSSVVFPNGTKTLTPACTLGRTVITPPAPFVVNPRATHTPPTFRVTFDKQTGRTMANPVTNVCIVYQSRFGDLLRCSIVPTSGACTEPTDPATACLQ